MNFEQLMKSIEYDTNGGCWIWSRCVHIQGYGYVNYNKKVHKTHRLFYELFNGSFDTNLHVLHKCDIPCCVNPNHLFLGNNKDNVNDKVKKNRQWRPTGEKNHHNNFKESDIVLIRQMKETHSQKQISEHFSVTKSAIKHIISGRSWKHIP